MRDLVFYDLEKRVSFDFEIPFYGRYVDDTFLIVPKDEVNLILETFNNYHERINFTMEIERDNKINFLDMELTRNDSNGSIISNWYKKKTYSGRLRNFLSTYPMHHKIGVIKTLVDKAIINNKAHPNFHKNNLKKVKKILLLNNYPKKFIDFHVNKRVNYITSTENNSISNNINS